MKEEQAQDNLKKTKFWPMIWLTVALVLIIFGILWQLNFIWHEKPGKANEFGDSFGMANALFSALAFAFLIVTAIMQKKELELQRKELNETRKELKKSAKAQDESQKALTLQVSIMARQSLLSSYQSLYQANIQIHDNSISPITKEKAKNFAKEYLVKIETIIKEIEKENKLFRGLLLDDEFSMSQILNNYGNEGAWGV